MKCDCFRPAPDEVATLRPWQGQTMRGSGCSSTPNLSATSNWALHDLKEHLNVEMELFSVIAADIMRPVPPFVTPNQRLADVFPVLLGCELRNIPVVNNSTERRLIGSISRAEALGLLSEAIVARNAAG